VNNIYLYDYIFSEFVIIVRMNICKIEDTRVKFKGVTFSNYKKSLVQKKLVHSLYYEKIEEAFFWTCEMMCTHLYLDLWNVYFIFMCKYIHIDNPKLPLYVKKKYNEFKSIASSICDDTRLRNILEVRMIFCSVTLLLCLSTKSTILDDLNYKFNFNVENIYENLRAPNLTYIDGILLDHDPKEYIIPFNELLYHLKVTKNRININYWINWIIFYDSLCSSKKKYVFCHPRDFFQSKNEKQSRNIIWIIWDAILKLSTERNQHIQQVIRSIFDLFCVRYVVSFNKKRKYMIYNCIELYLNDNVNIDKPIVNNTKSFEYLEKNVNIIFEQLKKNEIIDTNEAEDIKCQHEKTKSIKDKKMEMIADIYNTIV
jgi:hypothetical protein